ncbi:MAG TPA: hypothetical protein VNO33_10250, partial [Kofleriaceae bacterium]|nr:hypothetical protein [Kofleriaceae bacterium]
MYLRLQGKLFSAAMAIGFSLAACGGDDSADDADDGGDDGGPDAGVDILPPPAEGEGIQLGFDVDIEAGGEIEYCRYFVLPGDG